MIVGSLVIISIIIFKLNGWLIETSILIQHHCKNGKENSIIRQEGLIFDNHRIINWDQESVWNKRTIDRNVSNQWLINEQFSIIDLLLDLVDKISENGRNIYEWNQYNQTSNTRNWSRLNFLEWTSITSREFDILKIWNI